MVLEGNILGLLLLWLLNFFGLDESYFLDWFWWCRWFYPVKIDFEEQGFLMDMVDCRFFVLSLY